MAILLTANFEQGSTGNAIEKIFRLILFEQNDQMIDYSSFCRIYHGPADRVHKVHHMVVPSFSPFPWLLSLEFGCSPPYPSPVTNYIYAVVINS